jgi:hypothetical protein
MNKIIGFFILLSVIACKQEVQTESSFNLIDVSIYNGWTDFYCLKLFNDGKTFIYNYRHGKGESYLKVNLGKTELDSLSGLVKIIMTSKFDTLYKNSCADCGAYNLIIKTNDTIFKSFVDGDYQDIELKPMRNLISYCYQIGEISLTMTDTIFKYESRNSRFYPPPPPPPSYDTKDE